MGKENSKKSCVSFTSSRNMLPLLIFFLLISQTVGEESRDILLARARTSGLNYKPREDVRSICLTCKSNLCSLIPNNKDMETTCYQGENVPVYRFFNKNDNNILTTHRMTCGGCSELGYTTPSTTAATVQMWH